MTRFQKALVAAPLYAGMAVAMPVAYAACAIYLISMFGRPSFNPFSRRP